MAQVTLVLRAENGDPETGLPVEFDEATWTLASSGDFCHGPVEDAICHVDGRPYRSRLCYALEDGRWEGFVSLVAVAS